MNSAANLEELMEQAETTRRKLHEKIDRDYDKLIKTFLKLSSDKPKGKSILKLSESPALFKGKKPVSIIFPNGSVIIVRSWREVAQTLLSDCNTQCHDELVKIIDTVYGRQRKLLSSEPENLDVSLKIDEGIYFEIKLSTDMLLSTLKRYIFDAVGYDYTDVSIELYE